MNPTEPLRPAIPGGRIMLDDVLCIQFYYNFIHLFF